MANSDGRVVIRIEDNAVKAAQNLEKLQDRFASLANDTSKYERILAKVEGTSKANLPIYDKIRQKLAEQQNASRQAYEELRKLANIQQSGLGFNQLSGLTQNVTDRLRSLALQGRENTVEFKNLANVVKNSNEKLKNAETAVQKAIGGTQGLTVAGIELSTVIKGVSFVAITRELYQFGQQALKTAAEFEQLEVSFKIMAGGAAQGEKLTQSLIKLANKTPMTTEALARASQTLLSFGENSDKVVDDLKLIGDISGGQAERFQSLALAFSQVGSTGRLTGQDLLQMVNQGFNPLQVISEKTGKSMATLKKEMGEGKISFDMVKQAMIDATSEGGRFYGLMNEQSGTLNGLLSTNADTWQQVSKNIGDGFMPVAKEAVRVLIALGNSILKLQEKMRDFQKSFNYKTVESATKRYEGTLKESQYYSDLAAKEEKRAANARGAGQREAILSRAESYKKRAQSLQEAAKRYKTAVDEIKKVEAEANKPSTTGGFSSGSGGASAGTSASVQKAKDQYEKLQEAAAKAKREIELAAIAHGTSSVEVQNAFTKYQQLNGQLQEISKLFDVEKQKTEEKKGSYQLLSDRVSTLTQKLRDLAAENQVGSADWNTYKTQLQAAQTELDNVNKSLTDNGIKIDEVSKSISSSISSGLVNALRNGGNAFDAFSSLATTALQKILDKLIEMSFVTPILNALTGGVGGSLFSFFGFKNGAAFKNGNVVPYARGGVVNKPTLFPMANGGTGLMGEAGAEAVMPLKRMSNGKLGVEAQGAGGQVVNIYNYSGASVETRKRDDNSLDVFIRRVNDALSNERTSSGFRSAYAREDRKGVQAV